MLLKRYRQGKQSEAGFTIIEVLLASALLVLVLGVTFSFLSHGQLVYKKTQERVDSQSQMRIDMDIIKKELGIAQNVKILASKSQATDDSYYYFYVKDDAFVLQDEGSLVPHTLSGSVPLPGLEIKFSKSLYADKVVRVNISCAEGTIVNSDIFLQNNAGSILEDGITPEGSPGYAVAFKRID